MRNIVWVQNGMASKVVFFRACEALDEPQRGVAALSGPCSTVGTSCVRSLEGPAMMPMLSGPGRLF